MEKVGSKAVDVYCERAKQMGREAAVNAATWVVDGNSDPAAVRRTLEMLQNGDPEAYDRLPAMPTLSGEFADDPTPRSLAADVGYCWFDAETDDEDGVRFEIIGEIATAWEEGVSETFEQACEEELIRFLGE